MRQSYDKYFAKALKTKDPRKKAKLVKAYRRGVLKAAKAGDPNAQYDLASSLDNSWTFKNDQKEAMRWFKAAAEQGHPDALNSLGFKFDHGEGVPKNHRKAADFYRLSMKKGNSLGTYNLAKCFEAGCGVRKDLKRAMLFYQFSFELGHREAKKDISRLARQARKR